MKNLFLIVFFTFTLLACSKEDKNPLIGTWIFFDYQHDTRIYKRGKEFIKNTGYRFNSDGTFIERENTMWVSGVPPVYEDFAGTWNSINDTLIQINVDSQFGQKTYKFDIESIDETYLKVIMIIIK